MPGIGLGTSNVFANKAGLFLSKADTLAIIAIINGITGESDSTYSNAVNSLSSMLGGGGENPTVISGLNEIGNLLSEEWSEQSKNIDALNAICIGIGGTGGHSGAHGELHAWQEIESIGFAPAAPSGLTSTWLSSTSIKLDWTNGTEDCDGHRIYYSTDNSTFVELATVANNVATYTAIGLITEDTYYFYIKSYKGSAESVQSNKAVQFVFDSTTAIIVSNPSLSKNVLSDINTTVGIGADWAWFNLIYPIDSESSWGPTLTSGSTVVNKIYKIVAMGTSNHFVNFDVGVDPVGQIIVSPAIKEISETNSVKEYLAPTYLYQANYLQRPTLGEFLSTHKMLSPYIDYRLPITIVVIFRHFTWNASRYVVSWGTSSSDAIFLYQNSTEPKLRVYGGALSAEVILPLNQWGIARFSSDGSTGGKFMVNEDICATTNFGVRPQVAANASLTVNTNQNSSSGPEQDVLFVAAIKGLISDATYTKLYAYLLSLLPPVPIATALQYTSDEIKLSALIAGDYDTVEWQIDDGGGYETLSGLDSVIEIATGLENNTEYSFRCRSIYNGVPSDWSEEVSQTTSLAPFKFTVDQSTLHTVKISVLTMNPGYTGVVRWGDGKRFEFTGGVTDTLHDYEEEGTYEIWIDGIVDKIAGIEFVNENSGEYYDQKVTLDWTGQQMPPALVLFHCYNIVHMGVYSSDWPSNLQVFHIGNRYGATGCTGTLVLTNMPTSVHDVHVENHPSLEILAEGIDPGTWDAPYFQHIKLDYDQGLEWVVTGITLHPKMSIFSLYGSGASGSLHLTNLVPFTGATDGVHIDCSLSNVTGMMRGAYEYLAEFKWHNCPIGQEELDAVLAAIEARLTTYPPLYDCDEASSGGYDFRVADGLTPTDSGIAARIEALYTAAGKTCTVIVNK